MPAGKGRVGGARPGAGRPLSSATIKSRELVHKYTRDGGVLPFDALMANVRYYYKESEDWSPVFKAARAAFNKKWKGKIYRRLEEEEKEEYDQEWDNLEDLRKRVGAARVNLKENATEAAPYIHPRLQNIEADIDVKGGNIIIKMDDKDSRA